MGNIVAFDCLCRYILFINVVVVMILCTCVPGLHGILSTHPYAAPIWQGCGHVHINTTLGRCCEGSPQGCMHLGRLPGRRGWARGSLDERGFLGPQGLRVKMCRRVDRVHTAT